jgi:hypothetical protein
VEESGARRAVAEHPCGGSRNTARPAKVSLISSRRPALPLPDPVALRGWRRQAAGKPRAGWHPLFGRSVRRYYGEQRVSGRFVHVEVMPGVVTTIAAWMLDPVACIGMAIGAPCVAVSALLDLHHMLIEIC